MKKEYDFSKGKRGAVIKQTGKSRITIYIDDDILEEFRRSGDDAGKGYQTLINDTLKNILRNLMKQLMKRLCTVLSEKN